MKAIILVAGVSRRLFPMTEYRPKCLLELGGKTIFDHQMEALLSQGIKEVCLVLGYRREQIIEHAELHYPQVKFSFRVNHHFFETNTAYSLWGVGEEFLDRDFIYLNGDVLFEPRLLKAVIEAPHAASLAVESKICGEEEVKVVCNQEDRILMIGKELNPQECRGEFIGVARFNASINAYFYQALDTLKHEGARQAYFEAALARMAERHPLHAVDVSQMPCIEIDFPEDYEAARTAILRRMRF